MYVQVWQTGMALATNDVRKVKFFSQMMAGLELGSFSFEADMLATEAPLRYRAEGSRSADLHFLPGAFPGFIPTWIDALKTDA